MDYFPTFFSIADRRVVVIGGGEAALQKLRLLTRARARVRLIAQEAASEIESLAAEGRIDWQRRAFAASDLEGATLVVAASGESALDERVAEAAKAIGVPVNVVDRAELSDFIVPAIVDRDPVIIGISTAGTAPILARRIRERIEAILPARLGALARFAQRFRGAIAARFADRRERLRLWEKFFDGPAADAVLAGREPEAAERLLSDINRRADAETGRVAIVGAGPGDPELLTLKALRHLEHADVVLYDRLVDPAILDRIRRDARRIFVGKAPGRHAMSQEAINALLVAEARAGHRVVRLKGGDPFIFGRGGEELDALRAAGVPAEVVPGITAALGCAAAAGIPLTHRDHAQALVIATAEGKAGEPELDWAALAKPRQTLAIYMGVGAAQRVMENLLAHGLAPATPVALVENGTRPDQRILAGRLAELGSLVARNLVRGPALILIGEVASRAEDAATLAAELPERLTA
ncbi:MAG: siroheme synthase CysG [Hyphomicrobium sp.]|uniref:siroheme synthase CysG n=1 Tax=Hyphomicrobium sp. TaxID=82 RepID=UPI003D11E27B